MQNMSWYSLSFFVSITLYLIPIILDTKIGSISTYNGLLFLSIKSVLEKTELKNDSFSLHSFRGQT